MSGTASPDATIGIDVGGTFIDIVVVDGRGGIRADKVLTTPEDLSVGIMAGLDKVLGTGLSATLSRSRVVHATTAATNALLEQRTPTLGLITNEGFRDVLEIRRHARPDVYNHRLEMAPPLVPRSRRLEVRGRLDHAGDEVTPLDMAEVDAAIDRLAKEAQVSA